MPKRRINNAKKDSKRIREAKKKLDSTTTYPIAEAVKLAKETSTVKFDATVEFHANLGIDPRKGDQQIRTTVVLPHGSGKTIKVAAILPEAKQQEAKDAGADLVGGEELIAEIEKTKKTNFDVVITTPDMMKDMAKIAKILGPKGIMPNPKTETVTTNPAKAVKELKAGKIAFKNDNTANVHVPVGKVSFDEKQLQENVVTIVEELKKIKPAGSKGVFIKSAYLTTSMGPSVKLSLS